MSAAIDYGLYVRFLGAGRWTVTGSTERQMRWASDVVVQRPLAETMKLLGVTGGMVAREDRDGQQFAMNVVPRVTRTTVKLDDGGSLEGSMTTEFDAGDEP